MRTQGFNAFSYYHLADALQLRPAAIHYHFPTKDALALSIINRSRESFSAFTEMASHEPNLQKRLNLFIQIFSENAAEDRICQIGRAHV